MGTLALLSRTTLAAVSVIFQNIFRMRKTVITIGAILCVMASAYVAYPLLTAEQNKPTSTIVAEAKTTEQPSPTATASLPDNALNVSSVSGQGSPSIAEAPVKAEIPQIVVGYVTVNNVFFRPDPSKKEGPFLQVNDMVEILGFTVINNEKWYNAKFDGKSGWIFADNISSSPVQENQKVVTVPSNNQSFAIKVSTAAPQDNAPKAKAPPPKNNGQAKKQAEAKKLVDRGRQSWSQKNWVEAHKSFSAAYKLTPTKQIKQYMENAQANIINAEKLQARRKAGEAKKNELQKAQQEQEAEKARLAQEAAEREKREMAQKQKQDEQALKLLLGIGAEILKRQ